MKLLFKLVAGIFCILLLLLLPRSAFAVTIPHQITPGIPGHISTGLNFFDQSFNIFYESGKVIISSNPDGTGNTQVDDALTLTVIRPDGTNSFFSHFYPNGFCSSLNFLAPTQLNIFLPGINKVNVKLSNACGIFVGSSPIYLVNINAPDPTPTPAPSPTATPLPSSSPIPSPFLDLPWDYEGKGLSFNEAAQAINSYFDHEYPLLSGGIPEPFPASGSIIKFDNPEQSGDFYSSHDGYDYGSPAKVKMGDHILASADGIATLGNKNKCGACGNYIFINHKNGYQTRYYHMQADNLVVKEGEEKDVKKGDVIGKVGATGNVSPPGDAGAHIHFMVVQDKNKDGNFEDNIPDGITDPFGWQSKEPDPWPTFTFSYLGKNRTGNTSFYLWKQKLNNLDATLTSNGGVFKTERYSLDFPKDSTSKDLTITLQSSPIVNIGKTLSSVGSTIIATAKDVFGNNITLFDKLFSLKIDFSSFDLSRYKEASISIYSSSDGVNWTKEETTINWHEKTASAQLDHLTHFALLAERVDTTAPTTSAKLLGDKGQNNWFRSDVQVILNADDKEGLGLDYTMYRISGGDWEIYNNPITFSSEGHHKIEFYSADNDENLEDIKSVEFDIDKKLPETSLDANHKSLWPPNGKMIYITISGTSSDEHLYSTTILVEDEYDLVEPKITNFGQTIQLEARRNGGDKDGRVYIIKAVAKDLAGNTTEQSVQVIVPHDKGK